ncbi:MAG: sulfotransferase, partial [Candidatus Limnocylindrales bacterium]
APLGNEATYLARYEGHNRAVAQHFRDRPEALLVMRITAGDGWERLCPFLGQAVPDMPFPHVNAAAVRDPVDGSNDPSD